MSDNEGSQDGAAADVKPKIKPDVAEPAAKVTLVIDYEGNSFRVALKRTAQFSKVFQTAAKKFNVSEKSFKFIYDGNRIRPEETPEQLDMQEDDLIQAVVEQIGGGVSPGFCVTQC